MAVCKYHPERTAIGVCIRCRTTICAGCCTRMDGVNHCHACLQELSQRTEARPRGRGLAILGTLWVLLMAWWLLFGVLWAVQGQLAP